MKNLLLLFSFLVGFLPKGSYLPENLTFQNLEMVVKIEEDELDTVQSFTNSPFQAAINYDAYQRVIQVYENDQLLLFSIIKHVYEKASVIFPL